MEKSTFCFLSTFLLTLLVHRSHGHPTEVNNLHAENLTKLDTFRHDSPYRQPWVILIVVDSSLNTSDVTNSPSQARERRVRRQAPPNTPLVLHSIGRAPSQGNPFVGELPQVLPLPVQEPPPPPQPRPAPRPVHRPAPAAFVEHDLAGTMSKALGRFPAELGVKLIDFLDSITRWKLINLPTVG